MYVADRLIDAVCRIDYPRELLEIQVLDDSTDETRDIAELAVRRFAAQGLDVQYLHRTDRTGYKAGALEAGLKVGEGSSSRSFDADFLRRPDFPDAADAALRRGEGRMVQARWGHINQDYSLLTRFRRSARRPFRASNMAAEPRRPLLQLQRTAASGAASPSTMPGVAARHADEDLDSAIERSCAGGGSCSCLRSLRRRKCRRDERLQVAAAPLGEGFDPDVHEAAAADSAADVPFGVKIEAFFHLTANFNYILMCILSVLIFPSMVIRYNMGWYEMLLIDVPLFFAADVLVLQLLFRLPARGASRLEGALKYVPF
jgi:hypothetical protein